MAQSKLTKLARGRDCELRIYPYCNENPETTVFCHAPCEDKGMAYKSPDHWGAFGCSTCHEIIDGRRLVDIDAASITKLIYNGIYRTQKIFIQEGLIKIG